MKKKGAFIQGGHRLLKRAAAAGVSLMLAAVLIPAPGADGIDRGSLPFVSVAEAENLTAASGKCGENAVWTFDSSTGTLTIKGMGDMYDYDGTSHGNSPFMEKANIKKVVIGSGITSVGIAAFYDCNNLKSVETPESLERIGNGAFQSCDGLSSVSLKNGLKLIGSASFRYCGSLSYVKIPPTVEEIRFDAFLKTSLTTVTVPGSVKTIGSSAFAQNPKLEALFLENGVETLGGAMIRDTGVTKITLPETVKDVADGLALDNDKLEKIEVDFFNPWFYDSNGSLVSDTDPDCLIYVPRAKSGTYRVPPSVTHFGMYAFYNNEKITEIDFSEADVESFDGDDTFCNCKALKKITIPKTVTSIGEEDFFGSSFPDTNPFQGCTALEEIVVEKGNPCYTAVDGVLYTKDKKELLSYPVGKKANFFQVPDGVERISNYAFREGVYLKELVMNDDLYEIGYRAFTDCSGLSSLVIPPKVSVLEDYQFENCTGLKHLVLLNRGNTALNLKEKMCWNPYSSDLTVYTYSGATINGVKPATFVAADDSAPNSWRALVDGKKYFVPKGRTDTLVPPTGATEATWKNLTFSVDDPSVLKVSSGGVITPLKEAKTAEIYAFAKGGAVRYYVSTGFSDVQSADYFHDAVYWASDRGITGGIKDSNGVVTSFNPQGVCTRGQMIAFLWRMAGCPEPSKSVKPFKDVTNTKLYYYKAVLWGKEKGIIGGYSDNTFRPNGSCSRGQAVTFLWRMAGCPDPKGTGTVFSDNRDKKAYYYKAVMWASEQGITGGYSDGTFKPGNTCSRAQMVSFLYRYNNRR